jgi:hypothetical protein
MDSYYVVIAPISKTYAPGGTSPPNKGDKTASFCYNLSAHLTISVKSRHALGAEEGDHVRADAASALQSTAGSSNPRANPSNSRHDCCVLAARNSSG